MKLGIMQPYFLPYIGYWQLLYSVDKFVLYDNIQYSKRGWFNRNYFLLNGKKHRFTIPIKSDSDYLDVKDRELANNSRKIINKIIRKIEMAYKDAPFYSECIGVIKDIFLCNKKNLFDYLSNSISTIAEYLEINTPIIVSSNINIDHKLEGKDKVIAINKKLGSDVYINPIGGKKLYSKEEFRKNGITLYFLKMREIRYKQFFEEFIPNLSIIDVMMFNPVSKIRELLNEYDLI